MLAGPDPGKDVRHLVGSGTGDHEAPGLADDLLAGVAVPPFGGGVPARDDAVEGAAADGFPAELDDCHLPAHQLAVVEFSGEAISSSTLEGIITSWNPAAEWRFGYSGKEIIGQSWSLVIPGARADQMTDILSRIRAGQHVRHLETTHLRKDGT